jgi:hypothetical protein
MSARAWLFVAAGLLPAALAGCSADGIVTLGRAVPDPEFGDNGQAVAAINQINTDDTPTLTQDLLEIYFISRRPGLGLGDVYCARRSARELPFEAPVLVERVSSESDEVSAAISRNGLTLWVGSNRPGGKGKLDIWQSQRATRESEWGEPRNVAELNTDSDEIPRPPAEDERVMPFASNRLDAAYQTWLALRSSRDAAFEVTEPVTELWIPGVEMAGGFLTEDGRLLFFHRGERGADLYFAWRRSTSEQFQPALELQGVNTSSDERDPWINFDETRFFFASNRLPGRGFDVFATTLDLPRFE